MNEAIPCDMVLLSSDDVDGECSITTANLDGETNLKVSAAASKVASYVFCIMLFR